MMRKIIIACLVTVLSGSLFARDTISDGQLERIKIMTVYYTNRMSDTNIFPLAKCPVSYTVDSFKTILSQRRLTQNIYLTNCIMQSNPVSRDKAEVYAFYSNDIFSESYFVSYKQKDTARFKRLTDVMKRELQSYLDNEVISDMTCVDSATYSDDFSRALEQRDIYSRSQIVVDSRLAYLILFCASVALIVSIILLVMMIRLKMRMREMEVKIRNRKVSITNIGTRVDLLERSLKKMDKSK